MTSPRCERGNPVARCAASEAPAFPLGRVRARISNNLRGMVQRRLQVFCRLGVRHAPALLRHALGAQVASLPSIDPKRILKRNEGSRESPLRRSEGVEKLAKFMLLQVVDASRASAPTSTEARA